jgi:D-alanine-D-alanine ligase
MKMSQRRRSFRDVVLVADIISDVGAPAIELRRDLEQTDQDTLQALTQAIVSLGIEVTHYEGPEALALNANKHKDDIVLSIYGGRASRNRMALVPAVCETFGVRFIGPDTYGRIIAQDKEISKRLARECGLRTPVWRVLRAEQDLAFVRRLSFPVVVKPLLEGSSIGISQNSLVRDAGEAERVAAALLKNFQQPVLVEEFIAGREVALVAIACGADMHWAYSEVFIAGQPDFFEWRLFDANEKQNRSPGRTVRNIDQDLSAKDLASIESLLKAFGRYGYCRVDGRHAEGQFHFIELTPDAWIHPNGQFVMGFTEKGWSYPQVIEAVLSSGD